MAQRRMFSLSVVDTDAFLEMPISSRLLYYELGMRADDDGFVDSCRKILTFTGLSTDVLKVLIAKNFIIPFESGVIVIKHWRLNNYLQNDRSKPTIHQQELQELTLDNNNVYTMDTKCIQSVSIDKNSIDKNSIEYKENIKRNDFVDEFEQLWSLYPKKQGKTNALKSYIKARKNGTNFDIIQIGLNNYLNYIKFEKVEPKYIKQASTWFNQECWYDDYTIHREPTTKDLAEYMDFSDFRD